MGAESQLPKKLTTMLELFPVGVFVANPVGECLFVNQRWSSITGVGPSEAMGTGWVANLHPDDAERVWEVWEQATRTRSEFRAEYRFRAADGSERYVLGQAHGADFGWVGTLIEIDDYVRDRVELQSSELLFRTLAEASPTGIFRVDLEGRATYVSPGWTTITGRPPESALGRGWLESIVPDERKKFLSAARESESEFRGTFRLTHRDGGLHWATFRASAVKTERGDSTSWVGTVLDITEIMRGEQRLRAKTEELESAHDALRNQAARDSLTGLLNRSTLPAFLEQAGSAADRFGHHVALIYIDLDGFKEVNDTLGHAAGDELLRVTSKRLSSTLRGSDAIFRVGGDEFVVVLTKIEDPTNAAVVAQKMLDELHRPFELGVKDVVVSGSIGITVWPGNTPTIQELLPCSDRAMYRAKRAGGRSFRFFEPSDDRSGQQLVVLRTELTRAVQREEFVLHYQPQVDLLSGCVLGAEALLRWNHPERGLLPPIEFLEAAENTGLIVEIGEWVLRQAAAQRRRFAETNPNFRMGINVSMRQVLDPDFGDRMTQALLASGSDTAGIELELTETWVMEDPRRAVDRLWPLRQMGLRLSIDDFGTGYSNIRGLSELPVDGVKIDREFVEEIHEQHNHQTVVRAIEVLADGFNLEVIAEGIETEAERRWLTDEGITKGQGYLFAKPLPAHEFEQWAKAQPTDDSD